MAISLPFLLLLIYEYEYELWHSLYPFFLGRGRGGAYTIYQYELWHSLYFFLLFLTYVCHYELWHSLYHFCCLLKSVNMNSGILFTFFSSAVKMLFRAA